MQSSAAGAEFRNTSGG